MAADRRPLFGLVLAGGRSRRMGRDKALLELDGKTQLERAMAALAEVTERQFVSTRKDQSGDDERQRYPQIVDRYDDLGPVAGILSALEAHPDADWLIVACDLPNLDAETLRFLIANRDEQAAFTAFASSHDGLPEPLCAIYPADSVARIRAFVEDGIVCPRKMLIRSESTLLAQPNPRSLDNVNTPDDLAASALQR
ncbi:MAG: molybdenum cofactor guanylyltransferase [Pseudomonadota bacterium]